MADRAPRSRLHRDPLLAPLALQNRDLTVLRDLYYYRFASTPALMRSAEWASGGHGMQHFAKRLTQLWRAGYVSRFDAGSNRYLHGSRPFLYTIESGKAAGAARTGRRPEDISESAWRDILREATPVRTRVREALLACGFELADIDRVLHNNTELALKHYVGDTSGVRHHALTAEFLSVFWYQARMDGHAVDNIQPDGIADLSFREPEPRRHRELINREGTVVIKPDCVFTIAGHRFALEAETGTSSASALTRKFRRYIRAFECTRDQKDTPLRVLLYCGSDAQTRTVSSVLAALRSEFVTRFLILAASNLRALGSSPVDLRHCISSPLVEQIADTGRLRVALFG